MFDPHSFRAYDFLKDGIPVTVRSIHLNDSGGVLDAFNRLDKDSIYRRFFRLNEELTATELQQLTHNECAIGCRPNGVKLKCDRQNRLADIPPRKSPTAP